MARSEAERHPWELCDSRERFTSLDAMRSNVGQRDSARPHNYHAWECLNCGSWHLETDYEFPLYRGRGVASASEPG